jgi:hypothetical protein
VGADRRGRASSGTLAAFMEAVAVRGALMIVGLLFCPEVAYSPSDLRGVRG